MFWMWFWFFTAIALLIVEFLTADLVCIWFSASALILGILLAIFPSLPLTWQFVIFVVSSAGLLAATRPLVRKFLRFNRSRDTNLDRLIGQTAVDEGLIDEVGGIREALKKLHEMTAKKWDV